MRGRINAVADVMAGASREPRARRLLRTKRLWVLLLTIGFWFARPYYLPANAMEEKNADAHAILEQGSVARQISLPLMGLLACYMLWRIPRRRSVQPFRGPLAVAASAYLVLALLSLLWNPDPALGLKRLTVFFLDVLLVIAAAKTFRVIELAKLGFFACGSVALISFLIDVFVTHTFAPLDPDYRLLGVMSGNSQGMNLAAFVFCGLTLLLKYPQHRRGLTAAVLAGAALLFFTHSRTAAFSCLILSPFYLKRIFAGRVERQTRLMLALVLLALIVPTVIASGSAGRLLETSFMMGRTDTQNTASVSNRTPLWGEVLGYIAEHPFTGYGFHSFWSTEHIDVISKRLGWVVPNAHDIYLDETLSTGVAGMLLYAILLWGGLRVAWRRYGSNPGPETLLPFSLLAWLFITGWVESVPLDPFLPTFLAYVCLAQCMLPESPFRSARRVGIEPMRTVDTRFTLPARVRAVGARDAAAVSPAALR